MKTMSRSQASKALKTRNLCGGVLNSEISKFLNSNVSLNVLNSQSFVFELALNCLKMNELAIRANFSHPFVS